MSPAGHPVFDTRIADEVNRRLEIERRATEGLTDDYVSRLQRSARLAPYLSPRTLMNSARYDTSDETLALMNNAARENALATEQTNAVFDFGKKLVNPVFNAIGDVLSTTKDATYESVKAASRYLTATGESGTSFVNNYLLERDISREEFAKRFGKLIASPALLWFDQDMKRSLKYTELGKLIRDGSRQGNGFFMSAQMQYEQMLEVMGISPDGSPIDYAGRVYFDDAYVKAPIPEYEGRPQMMKQPATMGAFITALPRKITPNGAITSYKGLNPDSAAGSFLSGFFDAAFELVLDPSVFAAKAVGTTRALIKGSKISQAVSEERAIATGAKTTIGQWIELGKTANDLPSTSKSWSEIQESRRIYSEDVAKAKRARANKVITAKEANDLLDMADRTLTKAETDIWNKDALSEMIRTDSRFQDFFNLLDSSRAIQDVGQRAWVIRNKIFKNQISLEDATSLAQQTSVDGYRNVFLKAADGLGRGDAVLPEKITDFGGRTRRLVDKLTAGRITPDFDRYVMPPNLAYGAIKPGVLPVTASKYAGKIGLDTGSYTWVKDRFRHMFRVSPQVEIMINGSAGQRADAVDNFYSWAKNLLPDTADDLYVQSVMGKVHAAMTNTPRLIERLRRGRLVTETIAGDASRAGIKAVEDITYEVMSEYMRKQNLDEGQIVEIIDKIKGARQASRTFAIKNGLPTDYGQLQKLADEGLINLKQIANDMAKELGVPVKPSDLQVIGAAAIQEAYNHVLTMPDWRMIKSMVEGDPGGIGRLVRNPDTGKLTLGANAVDVIVNDVWKPMTLANLGYFVRNIVEGNLRMYLADPDHVGSLFNRPFLYWKTIKNKAGVQDLMGRFMTQDELDNISIKIFDELTPAEKNLVSVTSASSWGYTNAFLDSLTNLVKTGQVDIINKASISAYSTAAFDAIRKIHADPLEALLSRISHFPVDRQIDIAMEYLYKSDAGAHVQSRMLEMVQDYGLTVGPGQKIGDYPIGAQALAKMNLSNRAQRQSFLRGTIETQIRGRVEKLSTVPELRPMLAQNAVPKLGPNNRAVVSTERVTRNFLKQVENWAWGDKPVNENIIGGIFHNPASGQAFYIDDVVRSGPKGGVVNAKLIELETVARDGWDKGRNFEFMTGWAPRREGFASEMENVVRQMLSSTDPAVAKAFPATLPSYTRVARDITGLRAQWRSFVDSIFTGKMGRGVNALEKLPAFRQYKWSIYEEYYDSLSGVAIQDAIRRIKTEADAIGMSYDNYMGGISGRYEKLKELGQSTNALKAGYSIEDMDNFAAALAEKRMRNLFYDLPQKLNFETSAGVSALFQFIAATRIIMTDMARLAALRPDKVYRVGRAINGTMDLDLPGDTERGIVYVHPVTGKYVFRHPFGFLSKAATNLFTDIQTDGAVTPILESQVQGLNIGLVGVPQANPLGQVGIGKVLDLAQSFVGEDSTGLIELRKTLLPFESLQAEKTTAEKLLPAWMYKTLNGINAMAFGNRSDTIKREILDAGAALHLTGKYDTNTADGLKKLEDDAARLGLTMYMFGALSTFSGPASANPDYIVTLDGMDIHMGSMAAELQKMRDMDPSDAALRWVDTFGEEALIFLSGKLQMSKDARGILYTPAYLGWLKQNQNTIDKYGGSVAHFFGPQEDVSEYEFGVRSYLLQGGKARYANVSERVLAAQYVVGSSFYRYIRNRLPTFLNSQQQDQLRAVREDLNKRYRGFVAVKYATEDFETNIKSLRLILDEGSFADSELVNPLRQYMTYRDAFLTEMKKLGMSTFRSKAATPFRMKLDSIGEELARQNKSFERLYDNLLSSETDPAGMEQ